jgi:hypothetical protein
VAVAGRVRSRRPRDYPCSRTAIRSAALKAGAALKAKVWTAEELAR